MYASFIVHTYINIIYIYKLVYVHCMPYSLVILSTSDTLKSPPTPPHCPHTKHPFLLLHSPLPRSPLLCHPSFLSLQFLYRLAIEDPGIFSPQDPTSFRHHSSPLFTVAGERVFNIIEQWMVDSIDNPSNDFVNQPLLQVSRPLCCQR